MTQRATLLLTQIDASGRYREDYKNLPELMESIQRYGLIQPIVVRPEGNKLIAGGRRYFAHAALVELGHEEFKYVEVTFKSAPDEDDLREMELEENFQREDLTWQESALGILDIHQLKTRRAAKAGEQWTQEMTGISVGKSRQRVVQILPIARLLKADPEHKSRYWTALRFDDAVAYMMEDIEARAKARLATLSLPQAKQQELRQIGSVTITQTGPAHTTSLILPGTFDYKAFMPSLLVTSINQPATEQPSVSIDLGEFFHPGHCIPWMLEHKGEFHHIITDPPYAIPMEMLQQENTGMVNIDSTRDEHQVEENLEFLKDFVQAAYETLPEKGFLFMFCDYSRFQWLVDLGTKNGFAVQRWPVEWCKSEGSNQAAGFNFTKKTEIGVVMRKGGITLATHQPQNWRAISKGPLDKDFSHPFCKPAELWTWLIEAFTIQGQVVLDACTGSGSGVAPLIRSGRQWRACERAPQWHMEFLRNITKCYTEHFAASKVKVNITYNPPGQQVQTRPDNEQSRQEVQQADQQLAEELANDTHS